MDYEHFAGSKKLLSFIVDDWKLLLFLTLLFVLYFYYTSTFDFFEKKGVPFKKPVIFLGNLGPRLTGKKSYQDFQLEIYRYFQGKPYGGTFEGRRPTLYVFDPDLIKAVTIRDFDHFVDRNSLNLREPRYLSRSLLNLKGLEWKAVRSTLTPAFSSSRLKNMVPLIEICAQKMVEFLEQYDNKEVEMKNTMGHFTLEVIGACAFGIKCDASDDENSYFVKVAEKFNYMSISKRLLIFFFLMFMPKMFRYLNISFMHRETTEELLRMLKAAKAERRHSKVRKNDFLQLLLDALEEDKKCENDNCLDDDTIDAQALLFLIAGYETSGTLLSFAIHTLAIYPELQEKLRTNIKELTQGKETTYELLTQLPLLEGFLLETLRMYPPVARVDRACTKKYTLPGTNVTVNVGDVVAINVIGIHMDANYYPNPEEFKPERFMYDEKKNRPSHLYLPFGSGPRNCIGLRFAMLSAKIAMVHLIKSFKFSICEKTEHPVKFSTGGILLKAKNGLWVHVEAI